MPGSFSCALRADGDFKEKHWKMHHHRQAPALKHLTDPKNASEPLLSSFLLLEFLARWCFYLSFRQLLIQQWEHQWRLKGCTGLLTQEHKRVWNSEQSEFSSAFSKPFFWFCIAARAVWHWEKMRDGNQFKCSAHHKANIKCSPCHTSHLFKSSTKKMSFKPTGTGFPVFS